MNKIMTMHEKCVKYDFVVPLTQKNPEKQNKKQKIKD